MHYSLEARDTLTAIEMDCGDTLEFKLRSGESRHVELLATDARVLFTTLDELKVEQCGARTFYEFTCRLRIDGAEHVLVVETMVGGKGNITIDSMDLKTITPASLRSQIGYVSQRPFLFNDTVAANVAYAKPTATQAEVEEACRTAQAHEFIKKLPAGYNTIVGEDGGLLSGGQKQRITIARALLKNPAILLFDEATSALDNASEKLVADAIRGIKGKTVIVITHRPQLLRAVDRVLSLEDGRLVMAPDPVIPQAAQTL